MLSSSAKFIDYALDAEIYLSSTLSQSKQVNTAQKQWRRFILVILLLHIPLYFYPLLRLAYWLALPVWLSLVLFLPLASSQIVGRLYLRDNQAPWAVHYRKFADFWLGITPILFMTLIVFELIVSMTTLAPHVAASAVISITLLIGFVGFINALTPFVKTIKLSSGKLQKPLRFVQITDVHIGSRSQQFLENVMCKVNRLAPDFLCITGDFIDASGITEDKLQALKNVKYPIYFCIGNHEKYEDLEEILQRLENLGVVILRSDTRHFRPDVQVLGIDDMEDPLQVEKELKNCQIDADAFKVLLYHRPRGLEAAVDHDIDLIISGHTHNGQIFPFNFAVARVFERTEGMYQLAGSRQYVSQGTGTWGPVMRIGTRAEITEFVYSPE